VSGGAGFVGMFRVPGSRSARAGGRHAQRMGLSLPASAAGCIPVLQAGITPRTRVVHAMLYRGP